jgi:hypothetical protein
MDKRRSSNGIGWVLALVLAGALGAQELHPELAKGRMLEEAEDDPRAAAVVYLQVAGDAGAGPAVQAEAFLRLAKLARRAGDLNAARSFLESAAARDGAAAEEARRELAAWPAEQDPQDGDRAVERAIVRLMVAVRERQGTEAAGATLEELAWFGERAVPLLVDAVRTEPDLGLVGQYVQVLMKIGGPRVEVWVQDALRYEDPLRRRAVARGHATHRLRVDPRLMAAFLEDPVAEVRLQAVESGLLVDWEQALGRVRDEDPRVRAAAFGWLAGSGSAGRDPRVLPAAGRQAAVTVALVEAVAARAAEVRDANKVLGTLDEGARRFADPEAQVRVALALCRVGSVALPGSCLGIELTVPEAKNLLYAEVVETARELAPLRSGGRKSVHWVRVVLFERVWLAVVWTWQRDAMAGAIELTRLGFPVPVDWLKARAEPADWVPVFAVLDSFSDEAVREALQATMELELPEAAFDPLRLKFESWLARTHGDHLEAVVVAAQRLGRFGHPGAFAWCERMLTAGLAESAYLSAHPGRASQARESLLYGLLATDEAPRRALAKRLAQAEGEGLETLRSQAMGWLLFVGEAGLGPVLARAFELGVGDPAIQMPYQFGQVSGGAGLGCIWREQTLRGPDGRLSIGHRWSDAEVAALLEPSLAAGRPEAWRALQIDPAGWPEVAAVALRQIAHCGDSDYRRSVLASGFKLRGDRTAPAELRLPFLLAALADPAPEIVVGALGDRWDMPSPLPPELVEAVTAFVDHPDGMVRSQAMGRLGREQVASAWDAVAARLADPGDRGPAMRTLLQLDQARALERILPLAADPELASWITGFAKQTLDRRFVPHLIAALRSDQEGTRTAAREALDAIEFYVTQQQRWERLLGEAGLETGSAAEALLDQARRATDKKIRLTAIQSLGTLAVPETLPFLIQLMQDPDPETRAAAESSIQRINAK